MTEKKNINISISDFGNKKSVLLFFLNLRETYPEYFKENIILKGVIGAFQCNWKGSFPNFYNDTHFKYSSDFVKILPYPFNRDETLYIQYFEPMQYLDIIKYFVHQKLIVRLDYSNINISSTMDKISNRTLEILEEKLSEDELKFIEVSVSSLILKNYLLYKFPWVKIVWDGYKNSEIDSIIIDSNSKEYSYILDTSLNNKFNELKHLQFFNNLEVILNNPCFDECPYKLQCLKNKSYQIQGYPGINCDCLINTIKKPFYGSETERLHFVKNDDSFLEQYLSLGINNFIIGYYNQSDIVLMETLLYYFAKPEYIDELRIDFYENYLF